MACYEQYKPNEKTIKLCEDEERLFEVADAQINNFENSLFVKNLSA